MEHRVLPKHSADDTSPNESFFDRHEQLMRTTFSRDEIEGFYSRFEPLLAPVLPLSSEHAGR